MKRRFRLQAVAVLIAVLLSVPIFLILAGLLLPGDPDDPNTKAMILGLVAVLPFGAAAAGAYAVAIRLLAQERAARARLHALLRASTPVAVAGLLLLLAWLVAYETPPAETPEQSAAGPYLWRAGAVRMAAVAAFLLLITSVVLALSPRPRQPEDEAEPAGKAPIAG